MKKILLTLTAFLLAVSMTACAASNDMSGGAEGGAYGAPSATAVKNDGAGSRVTTIAESRDSHGKLTTDIPAGVPEGDMFFDMDAASDVAEGVFGVEAIPSEGVYGGYNGIPQAAGTLTAGEWTDNDHYSFWRDLFQYEDTGWEDYRSLWDRSFCSRVFVTVARNGKPVENNTVVLYNADGEAIWTAKTDNEGRAYLFYLSSELAKGDLTVKSDFNGEMTITGEDQAVAFVIDDEEKKTSRSLDLALVVDTTGSMYDELSYLQKELDDVISRVARENGNIPVRLSVDFYRDDGDDYVVRDFDFTEDIAAAVADLNAQEAEGGGDYPEKVNAALDAAINNLSWNEDSTKLLFIILDAPPHTEAAEDMNRLTYQAAEKGIRLIPILASGGDKETEFLMRDFALKTGGTYLFLTDDSGVSAGGHITPTTGAYTVEKLNDLMVTVINRYLAEASKVAEYTDINVAIPEPNSTDTECSTTQFTKPPAVNGEITMELSELQEDGAELLFYLANGTDREYNYGYRFDVEKITGGGWVTVEPTAPYEVPEIMMILASGATAEFEAPINEHWDLDAGNYRIVLQLFGDEDIREVYGYFSISEKSGEMTVTLSGAGDGNSLQFLIYNGTEKEYSFARYISVERFDNDKWTYVEPDDMPVFTDDMIILPPRGSYLFSAPVYVYWRNLAAGKYRVVIDSVFAEDGAAENLYGEFEVKPIQPRDGVVQ